MLLTEDDTATLSILSRSRNDIACDSKPLEKIKHLLANQIWESVVIKSSEWMAVAVARSRAGGRHWLYSRSSFAVKGHGGQREAGRDAKFRRGQCCRPGSARWAPLHCMYWKQNISKLVNVSTPTHRPCLFDFSLTLYRNAQGYRFIFALLPCLFFPFFKSFYLYLLAYSFLPSLL